MASVGRTDLDVFPLCLGGNVFGWTADEPRSRAVLDAYVGAGGNFIDTANSYLVEHGRSETIIGRWLADRGNRDELVVATTVGGGRGPVRNLRPETIQREAHASLERLQTDVVPYFGLAKGFLTGKVPAGRRARRVTARRGRARLPRPPVGSGPDRQRPDHRAARADPAGRHAGAHRRRGRPALGHRGLTPRIEAVALRRLTGKQSLLQTTYGNRPPTSRR
jgi:aryl-alcohol dehydrogenase-like predicted oxidoreductase